MWAVIENGSKQYKVREGDTFQTQRVGKPVGSKVKLDKVLLFSDKDNVMLGKPYLDDIDVEAEVVEEKKAKKVTVFKYKRRKAYKKKAGHRQILTTLKVLKVGKK